MKGLDQEMSDLRDDITHIWNLLNIKLSKEQSNIKQWDSLIPFFLWLSHLILFMLKLRNI